MPKARKPRLLSGRQTNVLTGKALVGRLTRDEQLQVMEHISLLYSKLDDQDDVDYFGTEGWRHFFGLPEGA